MASIINSTTTSPGGLISTGDSSNSLLIQTGDTTAITVSSGQVVSLAQPLPVSSGGTGVTSNAAAPFALKGANTDITSLSNLTTALSISQGGTGATTATSAFNALNPMTTAGDMLYESSPTVASRLPIGSSGQVLTVSGGIPAWVTPAGGGVTSLNGETGAIVNTDFNDIGSYTTGARSGSQTTTTAGTTAAGTSIVQYTDTGTTPFGSFASNNSPITNLSKTGTWRAMAYSKNTGSNCCGIYSYSPNLWVRIS